MEGLARDGGSRSTGTRRVWNLLRNSLRNRLGERHNISVAPGLFAVRYFHRHPFKKFYRALAAAAILFKKPGIIFFAALLLVCTADNVRAVPIHNRNFNAAWYSVETGRAGWDLHGLSLIGYPHSGWRYGYFNEGDNIEWIYDALENQYAFLDDTLYRIMGGSYLLGSVCYPRWHGFRYYYWVPDSDIEIIIIDNQAEDQLPANIEAVESGDILTFATRQNRMGHFLNRRYDITGRPYSEERIDVDAKAIPEPSAIVFFGLVAIQILRTKITGGN